MKKIRIVNNANIENLDCDFITDILTDKNGGIIAISVSKNENAAKIFNNILDAAFWGPNIRAYFESIGKRHARIDYI
ncbi:MAG: hypothetical protein BWY02_02872 [bacterium ADurb.Bin157]|nr:MAG: hypothetical protein BWY02_02872 [bacterium ADurb.Bin157]